MQYRTGFWLRRATDGALSDWELSGVRLDDDGALTLESVAAARGPAPSGQGLPAQVAGEATSPVIESDFPFMSAIPSWNARTPVGSWVEPFLRARRGGAWTAWFSAGQWASASAASSTAERPAPEGAVVVRRSVDGQKEPGAEYATDTLVLSEPAEAFQLRVRLCSVAPSSAGSATAGPTASASPLPSLRAVSVAYSDPKPAAAALATSLPGSARGLVLDVPTASQMVYPNGGNVWCSPTSVSMVLRYWQGLDSGHPGEPEPAVRAAVAGVYDAVYEGHGNWSFNAAYAGSRPGREAYVARFAGLDRLEPWIRAGVPVVLSVSWNNDEGRLLSAAPVSKSSGHLTTLVGFDERGDPVMNEPASPSNETVRRVYDRGELEARWLAASGGVAYVIVAADRVDAGPLFAATVGGRA